MASLIGQLLVELGINTAAFKSGLDKSTYHARKFAQDIKKEFGELGSSIKNFASEFISINPAFKGAGEVISASFNLAKTALTGSSGLIVGLGAASAGLAAIAAAATAAAVKWAELGIEGAELVHKFTLISEKTGLTTRDLQVFEAAGRTVGVTLEDMVVGMRKFDVALANNGKGAAAAQAVLRGLGVTAKDPREALLQVADAFSKLENVTVRNSDAIALFGRSGLNLVPILAQGRKGLQEFEEMVDRYGTTISKEAIQANEEWERSTTKLALAWQSVKIQAIGSVGIMSKVVDKISTDLSNIALFQEAWNNPKHRNEAWAAFQRGGVEEAARLALQWKNEERKAEEDKNNAKLKAEQDIQEKERLGFERVKAGSQAAFQLKQKEEEIAALVTAQKWEEAKAAQAQIEPLKEAVRLESERKKALESLPSTMGRAVSGANASASNAQVQALRDMTAESISAVAEQETLARVEKLVADATDKNIANTKAFKDALAQAVPQIRAASEFMEAFNAEANAQKETSAFTKRLEEQTLALEESAKAGTTIEQVWARNNATLKPLGDTLNRLIDEYCVLISTYDTQDARVVAFRKKLESLTNQYGLAMEGVNKLNEAYQKDAIAKELLHITQQTNELREESKALIEGNPFGRLDADLQRFIINMKVGDKEADELRKALGDLKNEQIKAEVLKTASARSGFDPATLGKLNEELAYLKEHWQELGMSAEQYRVTVGEIQAQISAIRIKTGGFTEGMKAGFDDWNNSLKSTGQVMHDVITEGLGGISDKFSEMVVKGKADWGSLIQTMEMELIKFAMNKMLQSVLGSLFGGMGGGGILGGIGSIFGSIGSLFGGKRALGGDMTPGRAYLVGERGPEIVTAKASAHVWPSGTAPSAGKPIVYSPTYYVNTPNADSFRRSQSQILSEGYQHLALAHARQG